MMKDDSGNHEFPQKEISEIAGMLNIIIKHREIHKV